ncbi:MAG: hypothetical protein SOX43_04360 [Pelistega sp.]|nr:hypothetical protein [Pelistega sp.]
MSKSSLIHNIRRCSLPLLTLLLAACSTYRNIPANSPEQFVLAKMGTPTYQCQMPDGSHRLIWSTQPSGQYAYATTVSADGIADKVSSVLNEEHFRRLNTGTWTQQDVVCAFGPPAETGRIGLGEKNEVVWTYRYKQANYWNNLMYVYFGRHGDKVTHYHSGPDPRYERDHYWWMQ